MRTDDDHQPPGSRVLRFYAWAVRAHWLSDRRSRTRPRRCVEAVLADPDAPAVDTERSIFVLRQYELPPPRPLVSGQARELPAYLAPPYDLMARCMYTGLRISELLRLGVDDINGRPTLLTAHHTIEITRKGRKPGYVIAPASLLDETDGYISGLRFAWLKARATQGTRRPPPGVVSSTPAAHR